MAKLFLQVCFICAFPLISCNGQSNYGKPTIAPEVILKSQKNFVKKYYPVLNLEDEFSAVDESSKIIDKNIFFDKLLTGAYLPVKLNSKINTYYQLYKMDTTVIDRSIPATIKSLAYYAFQNFKKEGKTLPDFDFIDLKGNEYNNENLKGKVVVLKFWFINCQQCVEEMPYLNTVVKKYESRTDVLFLSLAIDSEERLRQFLMEREFYFSVVANQKKYIVDTLKIQSYPTYFILNKEGIIVRAVGNDRNMEAALQREIFK